MGENKTIAENKLFKLMEVKNGNSLKEIESLIVQGVDINYVNKEGLTPLLYLLKQSNEKGNLTEVLQLLFNHGADIKTIDDNGNNALHYVCQYYQNDNLIEIIRLLIKHGVEVNQKTKYGSTALQFLCQYYQNDNLIEIVRLLIEHGVDVKAIDSFRYTALISLCENYQKENLIEILELLIKYGGNVNTKGRFHARDFIRDKYSNKNKDEILNLLDGETSA